MTQYILTGLLAVTLALPAGGCAVFMAAKGHEKKDTSVVFKGSNRAVIESKLGAPLTEELLESGHTTATWMVKKGNEKSSGRAWAHAGLDILSLGAWEIVATPYELAQSEDVYRFEVVFDEHGKVTEYRKVEVEED